MRKRKEKAKRKEKKEREKRKQRERKTVRREEEMKRRKKEKGKGKISRLSGGRSSRTKVGARSVIYVWTPKSWSFDKIREVSVLSYLSYTLFKCFVDD